MSDFYHAIVDTEAGPDEADSLAREVIDRLAGEGIIQPTPDPEATLGGSGYRPGDRIRELFVTPPDTYQFWDLLTNGMAVDAKRWVNDGGFTCLEGLGCPECGASYSLEDSVGGDFLKAVGKFYDGDDQLPVLCPGCRQETPAPRWNAKPHLGFAHLAFLFWNWPPFDSSSWKVDIPCLVAETLNHKIVLTYGRV